MSVGRFPVVGTADRVLGTSERFMATRAHSHVPRVDAAQLAVVSHRNLVASVMGDAVHGTS